MTTNCETKTTTATPELIELIRSVEANIKFFIEDATCLHGDELQETKRLIKRLKTKLHGIKLAAKAMGVQNIDELITLI